MLAISFVMYLAISYNACRQVWIKFELRETTWLYWKRNQYSY